MRIGWIENTIGNSYILFWFYRYEKGVWIKCHEERVPIGFRDVTLERIARDGVLVSLKGGMLVR